MQLAAQPDERFYGLGQHSHGMLNQRGAVIDLDQFNTEVNVPLLFSSRGYAVLWNVPSRGRVELAANRTRFVAEATRQVFRANPKALNP
jgi:alpha-D-xyloside xylohydrolase